MKRKDNRRRDDRQIYFFTHYPSPKKKPLILFTEQEAFFNLNLYCATKSGDFVQLVCYTVIIVLINLKVPKYQEYQKQYILQN